MKIAEALSRRTYGSTVSLIPRRQLERTAKQVVDAAQKFAEKEGGGQDVNKLAVFEAMNRAHYEYRILLGFVEKELRRRGHDDHDITRMRNDFGDMNADMNQDMDGHNWGHTPVVQEAYDTVPIHPYWGGPATPDNTQIHPYYSTDFYQALSGMGNMGGAGGTVSGIEGEEDTMDDKWRDTFSLDDESDSEEFSFTDFLGGCGNDEEHKDVHELKGGWKLYRLDDEGNNGGE